MNDKLEKKLLNSFPHLYRDYYRDPGRSCMSFGFECSDGWFRILLKLSKKIQNHIKNWPIEHYEAFKVCQVKSKFGTLRYYVDGADDIIHKFITEAELATYHICERCGKKGRTTNQGWIRTECYYCYKHRLEKHKKYHESKK